jgi:DNA-binding NtrC family response regulator
MPAKRILLIEDDPDIGPMLSMALTDEGYRVSVAVTASEARSRLHVVRYDLVIADWWLPDGDGVAVADYAAGLGAKTFLVSGYLTGPPPDSTHTHELLSKPVLPSQLIAAVRKAIGEPMTSGG